MIDDFGGADTTTGSTAAFTTYVYGADRPFFSREQVSRISFLAGEAGMWHHALYLLIGGRSEHVYVPHPAMQRRWLACFGKYFKGLPMEQRIMMVSLMLVMCTAELADALAGVGTDA